MNNRVRAYAASLACAALACLAVTTARAQSQSPDPDLLALGIGAYNVLHQDKEFQFRAEYRFADRFLYVLEPVVGVLATNRDTLYGYGGFRADIVLGQHFVIMPVAAVGYWHRGDGKDLGAATEFKTGGEFAYRFSDGSRLGAAFDHISNAGIGKKNPGVESALLVYSIPLPGWR
jgi:lipid A 3-O-deacylase